MSNKKSYKKTEEPLIKNMVDIRYDYTHISEGEVIGICMVALCLGIMLPGLIALTIATTGFMFLVPLFVIIAVFSCLPFGLIVPNYRYRKQKRKQAENIFANGTLVIGDIVSLNTTEIGNNSTGQKNFSYNIEYEDPFHGKTIKITTPSAIRDEMYIREEDLPLKVTIYCYNGNALAKSIINPPIRKMRTRKHIKWWSLALGAVCVTVGVFLNAADMDELATVFYAFGFASMLFTVMCIQFK